MAMTSCSSPSLSVYLKLATAMPVSLPTPRLPKNGSLSEAMRMSSEVSWEWKSRARVRSSFSVRMYCCVVSETELKRLRMGMEAKAASGLRVLRKRSSAPATHCWRVCLSTLTMVEDTARGGEERVERNERALKDASNGGLSHKGTKAQRSNQLSKCFRIQAGSRRKSMIAQTTTVPRSCV